jgi:5'-nucleotidase
LEKPVIEKNKRRQNVIINQVGWAGLQLGRIDVELNKKSLGNQNIVID